MSKDEERQENKNKAYSTSSGQVWWQPAMMMFLKFSSWIFAPVIIAVFIGRWLDNKYETEPFLFLATVGFAFLISMFGLIKIVKEEYKKIEDDAKNKKVN